jgi:hypothetical protein
MLASTPASPIPVCSRMDSVASCDSLNVAPILTRTELHRLISPGVCAEVCGCKHVSHGHMSNNGRPVMALPLVPPYVLPDLAHVPGESCGRACRRSRCAALAHRRTQPTKGRLACTGNACTTYSNTPSAIVMVDLCTLWDDLRIAGDPQPAPESSAWTVSVEFCYDLVNDGSTRPHAHFR